MATLEVHDGRGKVRYVTIGHDHPAIIGSDPKCDVVLADPKVLPYHGRLRFKNGKFKAEAFPEAMALVLNGQKVVAAPFRQGDEITIGACRIFLLNAQEEPGDAAAKAAAKHPAARGAAATTTAAPPTAAGAATAAPPGSAPPAAKKMPSWRKWSRTISRKLGLREPMPGQEQNLASSPLVLALILALGVLILMGFGLYSVIAKRNADNLYLVATEKYDDREYPTAYKAFDRFVEAYPRDDRAPKARVLRSMSDVQQFTVGAAPSWTSAIDAAKKMVKDVGRLHVYQQDYKESLGELVLKAAEGLADRATAGADAKTLAEAEAAMTLHNKVAGQAAAAQLGRSKLPVKLVQARAAVKKAQVRAEAIKTMADFVKKGSASDVFATRDALVAQYPDLAEDAQLIANMTSANDLVRKAVTHDSTTQAAETTPHTETLGPPVSLVLRNSEALAAEASGSAGAASANGPLVYAIAEGYLYALRGDTGAPVWHVPVGLSSPFAPIPIAGEAPTVLVFDARFDELVRYDGKTGKLIWRQVLGEAVKSPPLVLGNQIYQATPSGKFLVLDLGTGARRESLDMGKPLAGTAASDESGQYFYLTADRDSVYVVARDPLSCTSAAYLGHKGGSIPCAPARVGPYLIVVENNKFWEGQWTVFALEDEGKKLRLVQNVPVSGWTWETPPAQGSIVFAATDRGGLEAFAITADDRKKPVKPIASIAPDTRPSGPAFARARTDRELWLSSGRFGRFDLNAEQGTVDPSWTIERTGPAAAPIQRADRLEVVTRQFADGNGIALWGVDPSNGKVAWRTVLGAPWPLLPRPTADGSALSGLTYEGKAQEVPRDLIAKGGFVQQSLARPGNFYLPQGPLPRLDQGDLTIVVPAPDTDYLLVREGRGSAFRRVDLPAALGAPPVFWGPDLFLPGIDGRAYLIDPKTGVARAEPYVPPFDHSKPTRWRAPVFLDSDAVILADGAGHVRRLVRKTEPRLSLAVSGETDLKSPLAADPASTGEAVIFVTTDDKIRALAGRDLSPLGAWDLGAPRALGPVAIAKHVLIADAAGGVLAFDPGGQRLWAADLREAPPIGPPVLKDDTFWFLSPDGALQRRALADGNAVDRLDLGISPTPGLETFGDGLVIPVAPGTFRLLDTKGGSVAMP